MYNMVILILLNKSKDYVATYVTDKRAVQFLKGKTIIRLQHFKFKRGGDYFHCMIYYCINMNFQNFQLTVFQVR